MSAADAGDVLDFWFGAPGSENYGQFRESWFRKDDAFDRKIAGRFGPVIEAALRGELADWAASARGSLAQIVVLDQFTRNVFRGSARAFAGDARALAVARRMVEAGQDRELLPVQRGFVYLPYEHAEDLATQEDSVALYTRLVAEDPRLQGMLDYAEAHRDVIRRFGRFPHRNAALGRATTPDETLYLSQPGAGF